MLMLVKHTFRQGRMTVFDAASCYIMSRCCVGGRGEGGREGVKVKVKQIRIMSVLVSRGEDDLIEFVGLAGMTNDDDDVRARARTHVRTHTYTHTHTHIHTAQWITSWPATRQVEVCTSLKVHSFR